MTLLAVFIFLLAYYYFVLRKYNTLGFRLFSLCFFVSAATLYWWWTDWSELQRVERDGMITRAEVLQKKRAGTDNVVEVAFRDPDGRPVRRTEHDGISDAEFAELQLNAPVDIRYRAGSETFFLEKTFQRQQRDMGWFLLFPAFFLLLGSLAWVFLRRYRVHPHEGTAYEYVTDEKGVVVLDDARDENSKSLKKGYLLAKLLQILHHR